MEKLRHKFKMNKNGFTLAEVLITLVIIGVVAAMTIPTLINNTKQKQYIVAWRKSYSSVAQALLLMKANGDTFDDVANSDFPMAQKISKYMVNVKLCDSGKFVEDGCGSNYKIYYLSGQKTSYDLGSFAGGQSCMILSNGTYLCLDANIVSFDINGATGPNTIGKDIFFALIDRTNFKLNPATGFRSGWGAADGILVSLTSGDGTCQTSDSGYGCSAWYLLHDK